MKEFRRARELAGKFLTDVDPLEVTRSDRNEFYKRIREEYDVELPANVVAQAITIVLQNYREYAKGNAKSLPEATDSDIYGLHAQVMRLFYDDGTYYLNVLTGDGRFSVPLLTTADGYHTNWLPYPESLPDISAKRQRVPGVEFDDLDPDDFPGDVVKLSSSTLHRKSNREYVAHFVFKHEKPEPSVATDESPRYVVGVDRGRNELAYAAVYDREDDHVVDWWNRSGDEVKHYMDEYAERIREFKQAGVWEKMEDARNRRSRYKNQTDYEIANQIVELAASVQHEGVIIAVEALSDMGRLGNYAVETRRFSEWSYYRQVQYIQDKADEFGIGVVEVDAAYTSQRCSRCGSENTSRSGVHFECSECGYQQHADANAAVNIAKEADS